MEICTPSSLAAMIRFPSAEQAKELQALSGALLFLHVSPASEERKINPELAATSLAPSEEEATKGEKGRDAVNSAFTQVNPESDDK